MAHPNLPSRSLTMTEELEKIEQSITLTLQEIDSNFSKAHRIVTNSILPIVEQYGEHSKAVWEASMFWKQFFEASANVSLSGYDDNEEKNAAEANQTMDDESSAMRDAADVSAVHSEGRGLHDPDDEDATMTYDNDQQQQQHAKRNTFPEESMLDDPDGELSGSTPRAPMTQMVKTQFADYESPYGARTGDEATQLLSDDVDNRDTPPSARRGAAIVDEDDTSLLFREKTARLPDYSYSFTPDKAASTTAAAAAPASTTKGKAKGGPMRHHVLKKTFKLPTTPHRFVARMQSPIKVTATPASTRRARAHTAAQAPRKPWEDSPGSSPEMLVPHMRSEAFMSPMRTNNIRQKLEAVPAAGPRTPGVSIMTPRPGRLAAGGRQGGGAGAAGTASGSNGRDLFTVDKSDQTQTQTQTQTQPKSKYEIDWSSDSDDALGVSPPKTIQFALVPAKLVQTPAREASKRIVDDILATAGADKGPDHSPTMHKMNEDLLEDTF